MPVILYLERVGGGAGHGEGAAQPGLTASELHDHPLCATPSNMTGVSNKADIPSLNKKLDHRTDAHTQVAIKARMTAFGCKEQSIGRGPSDAAHRMRPIGRRHAGQKKPCSA